MAKLCANYPGERETNTRTRPRSSFSLSQFSISLFEKSDTIGRIPILSTRIVVIYIVGPLCQYRTAYLLLLRSRRRLTLPTPPARVILLVYSTRTNVQRVWSLHVTIYTWTIPHLTYVSVLFHATVTV